MLPTPESLGLPSRPGPAPSSSTSASASTSTAAVTAATAAEPAAPAAPLGSSTQCAHCDTLPKYTCPRCSARTCSLPCSKKHKEVANCSGIRDPAAFVPLNKMGQGTWDGDYAWLEAGRRRVAEWGTGVSLDEAVRVGLDPKNSNNNGNNKANGRNQSQRQQHQNQKKTTGAKKLDGLRWAIGEIGADVDIVPEGMGRRRTNQSGWNPKTRALALTVQLQVPSEADPDISTLVSHPRVPVLPRPCTATLRSLLPERLRKDSSSELVFVLLYHLPRWRQRARDRAERAQRWDSANVDSTALAALAPPAAADPCPRARRYFPPLDADAPLDSVFKGTAWIEFPTVLVLRASDWASHLEGGDAAVLPLLEKVGSKREEKRAAPEDEGDEEGGKAADTTQDKSDAEVAKDKDEDQTVQPAPKKPRVEPAPTLGLAALGAYVSDGDGSGSESGAEDDVDPSAEPIEWDSDGGFDFTHHPEVAVALHRALAADFGDEEQGDGEANQ